MLPMLIQETCREFKEDPIKKKYFSFGLEDYWTEYFFEWRRFWQEAVLATLCISIFSHCIWFLLIIEVSIHPKGKFYMMNGWVRWWGGLQLSVARCALCQNRLALYARQFLMCKDVYSTSAAFKGMPIMQDHLRRLLFFLDKGSVHFFNS